MHTLDDLKHYHYEATQFLYSELMLLKEVIPKITDTKLKPLIPLLISGGQTGDALLELAPKADHFSSVSIMLARAIMEKVINFCYVAVCEEEEYIAFLLHPIYRHYHNITSLKFGDDPTKWEENLTMRKKKQEELRKFPRVQQALEVFSETKPNINWTKKTLSERIDVISKWGKLLDVFFTIPKMRYYSDASEALHGSLYGCTYNINSLDLAFERTKEETDKLIYKDHACILLHLGMLVHESFTLISYTNDIEEQFGHSYNNRRHALNLLYHISERKLKSSSKE